MMHITEIASDKLFAATVNRHLELRDHSRGASQQTATIRAALDQIGDAYQKIYSEYSCQVTTQAPTERASIAAGTNGVQRGDEGFGSFRNLNKRH